MAFAHSYQHEVIKRKDIWWDEDSDVDFRDEFPDDEPFAAGHDRCAPEQPGEPEPFYRVAHEDTASASSATPCFKIDDVSPQELGIEGERLAASYLQMRGWEIAERNWTCPYGEADIIAYDDDTCVFVEVKTRTVRSEREEVYPELAVNSAKRKRYERMARCYMAIHNLETVRFDVVAICIVADRMARIHHLVNAFGIEQ